MEKGKICCKNNYKDIKTQQIIANCETNKHKKTDVCAMFLSQEKKTKSVEENSGSTIKGKSLLFNIV